MRRCKSTTKVFCSVIIIAVCTSCQTRSVKLPSSDREYWLQFRRHHWVVDNVPAVDATQPFYETIANSDDVWMKCLGIRAILMVDGAKAMPVFRRMVRDKRFTDEVRSLEIYGSTGASFLANELPFAAEYEVFLHWALTHEKGARSRSKLDSILQKSDPEWHGSRARLQYLEKTLVLADTEQQRDFIRRKIRENDTPLPRPVSPSGIHPPIRITQ